MTSSVRPAIPADIPLILELIRALAAYELEPDAVKITAESLERDLFGENPPIHVVIAEAEGKPAGFALYFFNYSTWTGRPGLYIEDIFVYPEYRGRGLGRKLFAHLSAIAVAKNCGRFQWQVLDWNEPSIRFYQHLGAEFQNDWRNMRLPAEVVATLAEEAV